MTDQEINIAIAEACGWTWEGDEGYECWYDPAGHYKEEPLFPEKGRLKENFTVNTIPNYCHDLNAMHEAEELLFDSKQPRYHSYRTQLKNQHPFDEWHATAYQRAKAFLRTLGKWKE